LGAVDPLSAHRQLQAQLTVPLTASAVKSVSLTVTGTATALPNAAKASAAVAITAPTTSAPKTSAPTTSATAQPTSAGPPLGPLPPPAPPMTVTSPLPAGSLPGIPSIGPAPTQSQPGNAAGLFPTVDPSPGLGFPTVGGANRIADTSALPEGASVVNAQLAGLAALALAFVLAVTRMSLRRSANQNASQAADEPGPESSPDTGATTEPGTDDKTAT
jgi:hypothetical protein